MKLVGDFKGDWRVELGGGSKTRKWNPCTPKACEAGSMPAKAPNNSRRLKITGAGLCYWCSLEFRAWDRLGITSALHLSETWKPSKLLASLVPVSI